MPLFEDRYVLHAPIYLIEGVPVSLLLGDGMLYEDLMALDLTAGITVPGSIEIESQRPAAAMLVGDLIHRGVALDDLDGATLTMHGVARRVMSHRPKASTGGLGDGEVVLMLEGQSG